MIRTLLLTLFCFSSLAAWSQSQKGQTVSGYVDFSVKEFGFRTVQGTFSEVKGTATFNSTVLKSMEVCLPAASFSTGSKGRDKNVTGWEEYLDVGQFPTICFTADKIDFVGKIGEETTYDMQGGLTLRAETHPISVRVVQRTNSEWVATFTIDRTQWSVGTGPSSLAISNTVELVAYLSLN